MTAPESPDPPVVSYFEGGSPVDHGSTPPAGPREMTAVVARRAWSEPIVRVWWLMAVGLVALAVGIAAFQLKNRHDEVMLMTSGRTVATTVVNGEGFKYLPGQMMPAGEEVRLRYKDDAGNDTDLIGTLDIDSTIGQVVTARVDPKRPGIWTARTAASPLLHSLLAGLAILPVAVLVGVIAWMKRKKILRTYRFGPAAVAVVGDKSIAPVAPTCYALRCSVPAGNDRRLFTVHVPARLATVQKGDRLWVLLPLRGGIPVAAEWFG